MSSVLALHSSVIRPSITVAMTQVQRPTSPASSRHYDHARAMIGSRSRSPDHASPPDSHDPDHDGEGEDEAKNGNSSNSDAGVARKRRRSRKGLDKKFACPQEGCGKSYSRAEHLYRHQLNHNPKQRYACEYPDCPRVFVRQDLCKRHMERHTAKGSALSRKDSLKDSLNRFPTASHENGQSYSAAPASPETHRPGTGYQQSRAAPVQYHSPKEASHASPYTPIAANPQTTFPHPPRRSGSDGYIPKEAAYHNEHRNSYQSPPGPTRPSVQTNAGPYGVLSPVSTQHSSYHSIPTNTPQSSTTIPYVSQQNFPPFSLPPSDFTTTPTASNPREQGPAYAAATTGDYNEHTHSQSNGEMMRLDQMANQTTIPVFGSDTVLNKSPYISIPEDFITYLFNSSDGSPTMGHVLPPGQHSGYSDQQNQYGVAYYSEGGSLGYFPPPSNQPQQVMSVTNLLDQNLPESVLSEEKSHEIFDFIKERFHEKGHAPIEWRRDSILEGDRSDETHMLSRKMMQAYIGSYWLHFSDQMPILHKPSFSPGKTPNLLLMAVMAIGASCLDRSHGPKVTRAGAQLSNFLAWHLRWEIFQDPNFSPPAKLWVFQTLILLELYEKMYSTRQLHERAHIHHATTITLMRRGRSLIGRSALDSPPNPRDDRHGPAGSRQSSTSGLAPTPDDWWNHWITNEATRRAAFAAFLIDSIHATMFGHSTVMVAHEMRLPLPCDELLWKATSGVEVNRIEANLHSNGVKPISFLEGLKRILCSGELQTNSFGRQILMAGLLNVSWHMNQRDLQLSSLGQNPLGGRNGNGKWRLHLTQAFDHWKKDFDKFLQHSEVLSDPYSYEDRADAHLVFESRTVLHHLAHMAMHVDIVDCQIFARAKRLLGRAIGAQDLNSAQRRMKDNWAPSAMARDATCYALRFLHSVLVSDSATTPGLNGQGRTRQPYSARDDVLLNRPWVLYFAALVVWCYGYALEGPCPSVPLPSTPQETTDQMREYLQKFGLLKCPSELRSMTGVNQNSAVLKILKDSFETTRWELLHEGATLLSNCIQLNSGTSGI